MENPPVPSRPIAEFAGLFALFFAVSLLLAWPALNAFFISDDLSHLYISFYESPSWFHWLKPFKNGFWRPYVLLSGRVFVELFGPRPLPFHLMAAGLHALAGACFFLFLRGVFGWSRAAAFGAAGLFVVHSGGWETLYTHQNCMDSALAASIFAGLIFWHRFVDSGCRSALALALVMLMIAMGTKETAIVAAPILAVWVAALGFEARGRWDAIRWREIGLILGCGAFYATWIMYRVLSARESYVSNPEREAPMTAEAMNAVRQMTDYLASAFLPYLHVIDSPFRQVALPAYLLWLLRVAVAAGFMAWIAAAVRASNWRALACLASALLLLAPPSVKSGPPASHYLYPAIPFLIAAAGLSLEPAVRRRRSLLIAIWAAWGLFLAAGYGFSSLPRQYVATAEAMERFIAAARQESPRWPPGQSIVVYEMPHPGNPSGRYVHGQLALLCFFPELKPQLAAPPFGERPKPAEPPALAYLFDGTKLLPIKVGEDAP